MPSSFFKHKNWKEKDRSSSFLNHTGDEIHDGDNITNSICFHRSLSLCLVFYILFDDSSFPGLLPRLQPPKMGCTILMRHLTGSLCPGSMVQRATGPSSSSYMARTQWRLKRENLPVRDSAFDARTNLCSKYPEIRSIFLLIKA